MKRKSLKQARKAKRLTLAKLAAKVGCDKSTLSRLERGLHSPMHDTAVALESVLGVRLQFTRQAKAA